MILEFVSKPSLIKPVQVNHCKVMYFLPCSVCSTKTFRRCSECDSKPLCINCERIHKHTQIQPTDVPANLTVQTQTPMRKTEAKIYAS